MNKAISNFKLRIKNPLHRSSKPATCSFQRQKTLYLKLKVFTKHIFYRKVSQSQNAQALDHSIGAGFHLLQNIYPKKWNFDLRRSRCLPLEQTNSGFQLKRYARKNYKPKQPDSVKKPWLGLILSICAIVFLPSPALADNLNSDNYSIDMGNINMTSGHKTSSSYQLNDTVGQTFQGQFDSNGYILQAGFQYIHALTPFSFTISNLSIDFTALTPSTPQTATNQLTVTTGSTGYAVTAIENHQLQNQAQTATIPDTSCDSATTCTISDANVWSSSSTYGFGYNMSGTDINSSDFTDSTYYRPFANDNHGDSPVQVMSRTASAPSSATATVTYKLNVSATQQAATYSNLIQFIATPTY